jgi:hypothetical protein
MDTVLQACQSERLSLKDMMCTWVVVLMILLWFPMSAPADDLVLSDLYEPLDAWHLSYEDGGETSSFHWTLYCNTDAIDGLAGKGFFPTFELILDQSGVCYFDFDGIQITESSQIRSITDLFEANGGWVVLSTFNARDRFLIHQNTLDSIYDVLQGALIKSIKSKFMTPS